MGNLIFMKSKAFKFFCLVVFGCLAVVVIWVLTGSGFGVQAQTFGVTLKPVDYLTKKPINGVLVSIKQKFPDGGETVWGPYIVAMEPRGEMSKESVVNLAPGQYEAFIEYDKFYECKAELGCPASFTVASSSLTVEIPLKSAFINADFCVDSDGEDYYVKGLARSWNSGIISNVVDYCGIDGKTLSEGYCADKATNRKSFQCPFGCFNGACLRSCQAFGSGYFCATPEEWNTKCKGDGSLQWLNKGEFCDSSSRSNCGVCSCSENQDCFSTQCQDGLATCDQEAKTCFCQRPEIPGQCLETDNGKDYNTAGSIAFYSQQTDADGNVTEKRGAIKDACGASNKLSEYYCAPGISGGWGLDIYQCPYVCKDGACQTASETTCSCNKDYNPVCGTDGKTYGNACWATQCAKVAVSYQGECKAQPVVSSTSTGFQIEYPCSKCGQGLFNLCDQEECLNLGACTFQSNLISGTCVSKQCSQNTDCSLQKCPDWGNPACITVNGRCACVSKQCFECPSAFQPVCGYDMKTYPNECLAKCASIFQAGGTSMLSYFVNHSGACAACSESDGGKNIYAFGTISGEVRDNRGFSTPQNLQDVCESSSVLNEKYCSLSDNVILSEKIGCPGGCENGACKKVAGSVASCKFHPYTSSPGSAGSYSCSWDLPAGPSLISFPVKNAQTRIMSGDVLSLNICKEFTSAYFSELQFSSPSGVYCSFPLKLFGDVVYDYLSIWGYDNLLSHWVGTNRLQNIGHGFYFMISGIVYKVDLKEPSEFKIGGTAYDLSTNDWVSSLMLKDGWNAMYFPFLQPMAIKDIDFQAVYSQIATFDGSQEIKYYEPQDGGKKDFASLEPGRGYFIKVESINTGQPPCADFGDVNQDGKVSSDDSKLITDFLNNQIQLSDEQKKRTDVNGDSKIDNVDIDLISAFAAKKIATFLVCSQASFETKVVFLPPVQPPLPSNFYNATISIKDKDSGKQYSCVTDLNGTCSVLLVSGRHYILSWTQGMAEIAESQFTPVGKVYNFFLPYGGVIGRCFNSDPSQTDCTYKTFPNGSFVDCRGGDFYKKGVVLFDGSKNFGSFQELMNISEIEDVCDPQNSNNLIESYCAMGPNWSPVNRFDYIPKTSSHQCPYGCKNGVCEQKFLGCEDGYGQRSCSWFLRDGFISLPFKIQPGTKVEEIFGSAGSIYDRRFSLNSFDETTKQWKHYPQMDALDGQYFETLEPGKGYFLTVFPKYVQGKPTDVNNFSALTVSGESYDLSMSEWISSLNLTTVGPHFFSFPFLEPIEIKSIDFGAAFDSIYTLNYGSGGDVFWNRLVYKPQNGERKDFTALEPGRAYFINITKPNVDVCSQCGQGLFNLCDANECNLEQCVFTKNLIGGECSHRCSSANSCSNECPTGFIASCNQTSGKCECQKYVVKVDFNVSDYTYGQLLAGVLVKAVSGDGQETVSCQTNQDGYCSFDISPEQKYLLSASLSGYQKFEQSSFDPQTERSVTISLRRTIKVKFVVSDYDTYQAISNAQVKVFTADQQIGSCTTTPEGFGYILLADDVHYLAVALADGYQISTTKQEFVASSYSPVYLMLEKIPPAKTMVNCQQVFGEGYWCGSWEKWQQECKAKGDSRLLAQNEICDQTGQTYCLKCAPAVPLINCEQKYGSGYWCSATYNEWWTKCQGKTDGGLMIFQSSPCNQEGANYCAVCGQPPACSDSDNGRNYYTFGVASDGKTEFRDYCSDSATLKEAYCSNNQVVSETKVCDYGCLNGVCQPKEEGCVCTQEYSPVCGQDGKTYSNACLARCAGIEVSSSGECKSLECVCTQEYNPVCGKDGKTYSNTCQAKCASTTVDYQGECQPKEQGCICTQAYSPVCGIDGNTYSNVCQAKCASTTVDYQGECRPKVVNVGVIFKVLDGQNKEILGGASLKINNNGQETARCVSDNQGVCFVSLPLSEGYNYSVVAERSGWQKMMKNFDPQQTTNVTLELLRETITVSTTLYEGWNSIATAVEENLLFEDLAKQCPSVFAKGFMCYATNYDFWYHISYLSKGDGCLVKLYDVASCQFTQTGSKPISFEKYLMTGWGFFSVIAEKTWEQIKGDCQIGIEDGRPQIYEYLVGEYKLIDTATILKPFRAYWVKVDKSCTLR